MNVHINTNNNYLRLRCTYHGKRYTLALGGLKDTKTNRKKLNALILEIESDIEQEQLDTTLKKYKIQVGDNDRFTCLELFQQWLKHKANFVDTRTLDWYKVVARNITESDLAERSAEIDNDTATAFYHWLKCSNLKPDTIRRRIEALKACWDWGINRYVVKNNPWAEIGSLIKAPQLDRPQPFTVDEVRKILSGFEEFYPELFPFVKFLLGTGCRLGEARAIEWKDVSADCSKVEIKAQLSRSGKRKPTKTGKNRVLILPPSLQQMLSSMKGKGRKLVFAFQGEPISDYGFYSRWRRVLKKIGVEYRKPYNTRHTFVSHCIDDNCNPVEIAQQTGHSVRVLFDHYAGSLGSSPKLPEMFREK
ncbi:tyrosine-type recombinase/integrase [Floridanema aerugineum]|uniref:Tyrosine-type recombinase/integrase n=1 Tax=Floridaenema aerugineum BLCC-F46 TaxID=3153654 RepID=A0ABV4X7F7_9CYAN